MEPKTHESETKIKLYVQKRPWEWLRSNPHEKWRCDIQAEDGSEHHGVGYNEAEALFRASLSYLKWINR